MILKTRKYLLTLITFTLILLWLPVSLDKLWNFQQFQLGILRQPLPRTLAWTLVYTLPLIEVGIVLLLVLYSYRSSSKSLTNNDWIWNRWFLNPFVLSSLLLTAFSGYIMIALIGAFDKIPCGCGSVITGMSWGEHLGFNLLFLGISILGLRLYSSIRRYPHTKPLNQHRHTDRSGGISGLGDY